MLLAKFVRDMWHVAMIPINPPPTSLVIGDVARIKKRKQQTDGYFGMVSGVKVEESRRKHILVPDGCPFQITEWAVDAVADAPARIAHTRVDDRNGGRALVLQARSPYATRRNRGALTGLATPAEHQTRMTFSYQHILITGGGRLRGVEPRGWVQVALP